MKKFLSLFLLSCLAVAVYAQPGQEKPEEPQSVFNWLSIITAVCAVVALVFCYRIYSYVLRVSNSMVQRKLDIKIVQDEMADMKANVVRQLGAAAAPATPDRGLEERLLSLEKRLRALEDLPRTFELSVPAPEAVKESAPRRAQRKYAKLPDQQNGFSDDVLQDQQNGEQIYELDIDGERGTFRIAGDAAAQKFALSDYQYYLGNGCTLTNQPVRNARITVREPGMLVRTANGWTIEKKAVIAFNSVD